MGGSSIREESEKVKYKSEIEPALALTCICKIGGKKGGARLKLGGKGKKRRGGGKKGIAGGKRRGGGGKRKGA